MQQPFCSRTIWSLGFWIMLAGAAAMLAGWSAGADPARGVPGQPYRSQPYRGQPYRGQAKNSAQGDLLSGHAERGLISYVQTSETRPTSVILIDPAGQVMSVYHIVRETGEIQLKSVRKFAWDLGLTDYNTSDPLPEEIRKGLQRQ